MHCSVKLFIIVTQLSSLAGSVTNYFLFSYVALCPLGGYWSGSLYKNFYYPHQTPSWKLVFFLTASLFPFILCGIGFLLNWISVYYDTQNTIPIKVVLSIILIYICLVLPLTLVGTLVGRSWSGKPDIPCRINAISRPIMKGPWYYNPNVNSKLKNSLFA